MVRKLLASTAVATLLVSGAIAQAEEANTANADVKVESASATDTGTFHTPVLEDRLASKLIGETVYESTAADADTVGEIKDVILGQDGQAEAVIIGVGGFLGIGEKNVAVNYDQINWQQDGDGEDWLVVDMTRQQFENAPDFDYAALEPVPATGSNVVAADNTAVSPATGGQAADDDAMAANDNATAADDSAMASDDTATAAEDDPAMAADDSATAPKDDSAMAADDSATAPKDDSAMTANDNATAVEDDSTMASDDTVPEDDSTMAAKDNATATEDASALASDDSATDETQTSAIPNQDNMNPVAGDNISAEKLIGTVVYGADDENIGEIGDVILTQDGGIDSVIVDVGGFLGIGEKPVAVAMDDLKFVTDADGQWYLYTNFTEEQLDSQAAYDENTYSENRDQQRLNYNQ